MTGIKNLSKTGTQTYDKMSGNSDSSLKYENGCIDYIIGKIVSIYDYTIVLENNYMGYIIRVANPSEFELGRVKKLYTLKIARVSSNLVNEIIYGFVTNEQKQAFISNGYRFTTMEVR